MKIITDEKEITPMLIEGILRNTKSLEQVEVKEIKIMRTSSTITSNICFIQVNYSNESPKTAPKRFFLKMSKKEYDPEVGRKEVIFYNSIANQIGALPVIPCYDAKFNEKTQRWHILLEDISITHFQTEYPLPPTNINCERYIEGLGKLHAFWWDDEHLEEFIGKNHWIKNFDYEKRVNDQEKLLQKFLNFIGNRISKPRKNILNNSIEFTIRYRWECHKEEKNLTLCHGDAHAWNAFYPKGSIDGKLYLSDWQYYHVFKGMADVAYFMGLHWHPERRKRLEKVLLRKYHEILKESGINNYSWEECYNDYRSAIVLSIHLCPIWQWTTKKVPAYVWWYNLENLLSAFEDLNCNELLKLK